MKKLKVAIIGCGYVTVGHFNAWRRIPEANIVAVSDLNESLAKSVANEWRVPHYYKTLSEIVKAEQADVIDICTPPQAHTLLAIEAMTAGINVLIEKPMAMTVKDAERIVESQKISGVKAGVIHNWLFDLPVLRAREMIKKGVLGEVLNAEIEALNTKEDSMAANEHHWSHQLPGGRFSEMLAHPIYLLRDFLQGEVDCTCVEVSKDRGYPWMKSDELCAMFKVGKKLARAYASFISSREAIYVSLYCTEGILKLDIINSTLNMLPARRTSRYGRGYDSIRQASQLLKWTALNAGKVASRNWYSGHDMCIKLFAESVLSNHAPPVTVKDALEVTKTLEYMCKQIEEAESV